MVLEGVEKVTFTDISTILILSPVPLLSVLRVPLCFLMHDTVALFERIALQGMIALSVVIRLH